MSIGKEHDKACIRTSFLGSIILFLFFDAGSYAIAFGIGSLSGLMLSPDLDLPKSNPKRRWGAMGFLWWIYEYCIPHRSCLSHGIIVGTVGRIAYLFAVLIAMLMFSYALASVIKPYGVSEWAYPWPYPPSELLSRIWAALNLLDPLYYLWSFAGLALADTIHLMMDKKSTADKTFLRKMQNRR